MSDFIRESYGAAKYVVVFLIAYFVWAVHFVFYISTLPKRANPRVVFGRYAISLLLFVGLSALCYLKYGQVMFSSFDSDGFFLDYRIMLIGLLMMNTSALIEGYLLGFNSFISGEGNVFETRNWGFLYFFGGLVVLAYVFHAVFKPIAILALGFWNALRS